MLLSEQWHSNLKIDALTDLVAAFSKFEFIVLMGDFNVNMLHDSNVIATKQNFYNVLISNRW